MKMDDGVVVRTCSNRLEAELAASWLDAGNIPCELVADDAGGAFPMMELARGVKLVVARADEDRAREILERSDLEVDDSVLDDATTETAGDSARTEKPRDPDDTAETSHDPDAT